MILKVVYILIKNEVTYFNKRDAIYTKSRCCFPILITGLWADGLKLSVDPNPLRLDVQETVNMSLYVCKY